MPIVAKKIDPAWVGSDLQGFVRLLFSIFSDYLQNEISRNLVSKNARHIGLYLGVSEFFRILNFARFCGDGALRCQSENPGSSGSLSKILLLRINIAEKYSHYIIEFIVFRNVSYILRKIVGISKIILFYVFLAACESLKLKLKLLLMFNIYDFYMKIIK